MAKDQVNGEKRTGKRLLSLDALRGFDMFFITGGAAAISGICAALGCQDGWLAAQMKHVEWTGLAQHDTIFPLFLFFMSCLTCLLLLIPVTPPAKPLWCPQWLWLPRHAVPTV